MPAAAAAVAWAASQSPRPRAAAATGEQQVAVLDALAPVAVEQPLGPREPARRAQPSPRAAASEPEPERAAHRARAARRPPACADARAPGRRHTRRRGRACRRRSRAARGRPRQRRRRPDPRQRVIGLFPGPLRVQLLGAFELVHRSCRQLFPLRLSPPRLAWLGPDGGGGLLRPRPLGCQAMRTRAPLQGVVPGCCSRRRSTRRSQRHVPRALAA